MSDTNGQFCWVDVAVDNVPAAKEFYGKMFGWEGKDNEMDGMNYIMMMHGETGMAGMYELTPQMREMNVPPCWMSYIATDNIPSTLEKITNAGGTVIMPETPAGEFGKMALATDAEGAVFQLWQATQEGDMGPKHVHGALCWNELGIRDLDKAINFYGDVFGWTANTQNMGGMDYTTFSAGDIQVGGCYVMDDKMEGVPANWAVYFTVNSADDAIATVEAENGKIMMPKTHIPGVGQIAVFTDPQGAVFGIVEEEPRA